MKKADIKTGVVYAYQRSASSARSPSCSWSHRQTATFCRATATAAPALRSAPQARVPSPSAANHGPTGTPWRSSLPRSRATCRRSPQSPCRLRSGNLGYGREDGVEFDVMTTLGQITGVYERRGCRPQASSSKSRSIGSACAPPRTVTGRAGSHRAFSKAGIESTTGDVLAAASLLTLDEARSCRPAGVLTHRDPATRGASDEQHTSLIEADIIDPAHRLPRHLAWLQHHGQQSARGHPGQSTARTAASATT